MTKVLITGASGSGKSTIIEALKKQGFTAYNTDDLPKVTRFEIKASGEPASWPKGAIDWNHYAWNFQENALLELMRSSEDIFIGAVTSNQEDYYSLFNIIITLVVNDATLLERLQGRTTHRHNHPDNIKGNVESNKRRTKQFIASGAIPVDNNRPVDQVVNEIIEITHVAKPSTKRINQ